MIRGQLSALLIGWMGIECVEDPADADNVICDFKNLWILLVVVNLTTLIPLVFIRKVPDEEQLRIIGEELKASTLDREEDVVHKQSTKADLIGLYWFCENRVFPFCRKNVCCRCCQDDQPTEVEMEEPINIGNETISTQTADSVIYPVDRN